MFELFSSKLLIPLADLRCMSNRVDPNQLDSDQEPYRFPFGLCMPSNACVCNHATSLLKIICKYELYVSVYSTESVIVNED